MRRKSIPRRATYKKVNLPKKIYPPKKPSIGRLLPRDIIDVLANNLGWLEYAVIDISPGSHLHSVMMQHCGRVLGDMPSERSQETTSKLDDLFKKSTKNDSAPRSFKNTLERVAIEVLKIYGISQQDITTLLKRAPRHVEIGCRLEDACHEVMERWLPLAKRASENKDSETGDLLRDAFLCAIKAARVEVYAREVQEHGKKIEDIKMFKENSPQWVNWVGEFPSISEYAKFMRNVFVPAFNAAHFHVRRCVECGETFNLIDKRAHHSKYCSDECAARGRSRGRNRIGNGRSTAENAANKIAVQLERHLSKCRICEKEGMCTTGNKLLAADDVARRRLFSLEDWQLNEPVEEDEEDER